MTTKPQPATDSVATIVPCVNCLGTGLVYGGFKYRKTCPVCHGSRIFDPGISTNREIGTGTRKEPE